MTSVSCCFELFPPPSRWRFALVAGIGTYIAMLIYTKKTKKADSGETPGTSDTPLGKNEHTQMQIAALDTMVEASVMHLPVPPLHLKDNSDSDIKLSPTAGWLRCMEAMAEVEKPRSARPVSSNVANKVLISSYNITEASGTKSKQRVDFLLAKHAKHNFPHLVRTLSADPSLVIVLLDAPNMLTTKALVETFPELSTPAFAARVCIPQADPLHYSMLVAEASLNVNVRFQRLDAWLTSNAKAGLRVPIFFADYETSVYGKQCMQLSPLQDIQRFLRYGYAGHICLLGVTLSYRWLHKDYYPASAPVLTENDVVGFVEYEAACVGMVSELVECFRYGMTFSLFLLKKKQNKDSATTIPPNFTTATSEGKKNTSKTSKSKAEKETPMLVRRLPHIRPKQSRLIHGKEHVTRRWQHLGFVVAGGGLRLALQPAREILADKDDTTLISVLCVNRSEADMHNCQELRDLVKLYPSRIRAVFSITSDNSVERGWCGFTGRGDVAMGQSALPSPFIDTSHTVNEEQSEAKKSSRENRGVMVIVCGKVQGDEGEEFVELWGGMMGAKVRKRGKSTQQRVQGALGGILKDIGFTADQVFQI